MRVHSDAIDYKTRIAALSSGMGRFSFGMLSYLILSFFNWMFTQSTQFGTTLVSINRNEPS